MTRVGGAVGLRPEAIRDRAAEVRGREALGVVWRIGIAMAILLLAFAVFDVLGHPSEERWWRLATDLVPAAVLGLIVLAARRGIVTTANAGWFVTAGSLAVSGAVLATALVSAQAPGIVYLIIMTVVNGASALDNRQFTVAQTVPVLGALAALLLVPGIVDPALLADWLVTVIVALAAAIAIHVARAHGFEQMAHVLELLEQQAIEDPLTGLGTRRAFDQMADVVTASAKVAELSIFAIFIDVDGLKAVNDARGHEAGDRILLAVAEAMRDSARSRDVLVRWGGDEFAVLGIGDPQAAERWRTSVLQRVVTLNPLPDEWPGSVSVGFAVEEPGAVSAADLVVRADTAMYDDRRSKGADRP